MLSDAHVAAAAAALQAGRFGEAVVQARSAIARASNAGQAHGILAIALERAGRFDEARDMICRIVVEAVADTMSCDALAFAATHLGQYEVANRLYRRAVELDPRDHRLWHSLGASERSFGRLEAAEWALDRAIALDPEDYPAIHLRSDLRIQSGARNHIDALRSRLAAPLPDGARMFLAFALAKELDDVGDIAAAFCWYEEGNRLRRRNLDYGVAMDVRKLARIRQAFPSDLLARHGEDLDSDRFIFVFGLPRSGTTLVERILTGHEGVGSNGETDNFSNALVAASRTGSGDIFARAAAADPGMVARDYSHRATQRTLERLIIDKLPLNYLYAGPIYLALPRSRLIWVRRNPIDICFAIYRTLFAAGYPFAYDLREIAIYYAAYRSLMAHWRDALPNRLHEVKYERLVDAPVETARAFALHCGIAWDVRAVDPRRNPSVALTASAAQVRRPIYRSSANRWIPYEKFLRPLVAELERQGVDPEED